MLVLQPFEQLCGDQFSFHHKSIMAVGGVDLYQGSIGQLPLHESLFFHGAEDIAADPYDQGALLNTLEHCIHIGMAAAGEVVTVHGPRETEVRKGIESFHQFFSLVMNIGGGAEAIEFGSVGIGLVFHHDAVIPVSEHADGAGGLEAGGACIRRIILPGGICFNGQALGGVNGNAPGALRRRGGQQEQLLDHFRLCNRPFHGLVAAHTASHEEMDPADAQVTAEKDMGLHHVPDGDEGELMIIWLPGPRIGTEGAGGTVTGTDDISTNYKVFLRIDHFSRSDHAFPPIGRIGIGGKGMAYPYYLAVGLQLAISMESDGQFRQYLPGLQLKRFVKVKSLHSVNTDSGCKVNACMNYICKNLYHDKN